MPRTDGETRIHLGVARDQGPRPTCLSFALSELHRAAAVAGDLLSPESLHRRAALRAGRPVTDGLAVPEAVDGLALDGQTTEVAWPYGRVDPLDPGATSWRANAKSTAVSLPVIANSLTDGRLVGAVLDIDTPFFLHKGPAALDLDLNSRVQGRHAVVFCGVRGREGELEYLMKNSWGDAWGLEGYAWLTSRLVSARSSLLFWI